SAYQREMPCRTSRGICKWKRKSPKTAERQVRMPAGWKNICKGAGDGYCLPSYQEVRKAGSRRWESSVSNRGSAGTAVFFRRNHRPWRLPPDSGKAADREYTSVRQVKECSI